MFVVINNICLFYYFLLTFEDNNFLFLNKRDAKIIFDFSSYIISLCVHNCHDELKDISLSYILIVTLSSNLESISPFGKDYFEKEIQISISLLKISDYNIFIFKVKIYFFISEFNYIKIS